MKNPKHFLMIAAMLMSIHVYSVAQAVDNPAPDFTLTSLDDQTFTLSNQTGKVVFIFLFGWNCSHCKTNAPNTQSDIYNVYKNNPDFIAVGIDTWDGNAFSVNGFAETYGLTYSILLDGSNLLSTYNTTYDRILVVDKEGTLKYKSTDVANKTITAEASSVISSLLEGTSAIEDAQSPEVQFQIAPNPVSNQLAIKAPANTHGKAQLQIYDLKGQLIMNQNIEISEINKVDVAGILPGYYMMRLISNSTIWSDRFIKTE